MTLLRDRAEAYLAATGTHLSRGTYPTGVILGQLLF
jgi:hypothetical protein